MRTTSESIVSQLKCLTERSWVISTTENGCLALETLRIGLPWNTIYLFDSLEQYERNDKQNISRCTPLCFRGVNVTFNCQRMHSSLKSDRFIFLLIVLVVWGNRLTLSNENIPNFIIISYEWVGSCCAEFGQFWGQQTKAINSLLHKQMTTAATVERERILNMRLLGDFVIKTRKCFKQKARRFLLSRTF